MKNSKGKGVIGMGDSTSHGGTVTSACSDFKALGRPVAVNCDMTACLNDTAPFLYESPPAIGNTTAKPGPAMETSRARRQAYLVNLIADSSRVDFMNVYRVATPWKSTRLPQPRARMSDCLNPLVSSCLVQDRVGY